MKLCENLKKSANFDFVAVPRCENLVDLEKSEKMRLLSLSEASIQKRTSPPQFDHLAAKSDLNTVPYLIP